MPKRGKNITRKERADIESLLNEDKSVPFVMRKTGRSRSAIYEVRRQLLRKHSNRTAMANLSGHWYELTRVLEGLEGVEPLTLAGQELLPFWLRAHEESWPVSKGRVYRGTAGLVMRLAVEEQLEWEYLHQHMPDDPVWSAIDLWKDAMAKDIGARLALYATLLFKVEEGVGIPVSRSLNPEDLPPPYLHPRFVMLLYDQVFTRAVGRQPRPVTAANLRADNGGPRVFVQGSLVMQTDDPGLWQKAASFFLEAQVGLTEQEEVREAAAQYQVAVTTTEVVNRNVRRILLYPGPPPGSVCEACQAWIGH